MFGLSSNSAIKKEGRNLQKLIRQRRERAYLLKKVSNGQERLKEVTEEVETLSKNVKDWYTENKSVLPDSHEAPDF